jgi:hypothetical protein
LLLLLVLLLLGAETMLEALTTPAPFALNADWCLDIVAEDDADEEDEAGGGRLLPFPLPFPLALMPFPFPLVWVFNIPKREGAAPT